ncbi:hypothetical protein OBCHQ24_08515 [Oceanobacillus iheyensis]|nr:hypothetical protein OBCHQ24_08515 [Oceanobacillus iheyensis]
MNAIGMFVQQIQSVKVPAASEKTSSRSDLFQSMLNGEHGNEATGLKEMILLAEQNSNNKATELATASDQDTLTKSIQPALSLIFQSGEEKNNGEKIRLTEEEQEKLMDLLTILMESENNQEKLEVGMKLDEMMNLPPLFNEFVQLLSEVAPVLSQITSKEDAEKAAPKLLQLLQQWTSLQKKAGAANRGDAVLNLMKKDGTSLQGVWKDLIQSFEKRNQMATKHQYNTDSKVTSSDIAKWLSSALEQHAQPTLKTEGLSNTASVISGPMSQVEQLVIHVNSTQSTKSPDKQLLEQFQQLIQSSKFAAKSNGTTQLSISLRPENLGDMMVKLTQINGEMTVKILVSSQATKEMMEGNIHQLRNMFSPHQVVIEKQDMAVQQSQNLQEEQDNQHSDQQQDRSGDTRQDEESHAEDDFATQFHELLMIEKV